MRRRGSFPLPLFALLGLLAGVAWLTRNPESPILETATRWPVVGPAAARFRALYLPPPVARPRPRGDGPTIVVLPPDEEELARRAEFEIAARDSVWLTAGTALREAPDEAAPVVAETAAVVNPTVVERAGEWVRVRRGALAGWVRLEEAPAPGEPPLGRDPEPVLPLPARPPDAERLAAGRQLLGSGERVVQAGPYPLYTNSRDATLERALRQVASGIESLYVRRFGLVPLGEPAAAILLFGRAEELHAFRRGTAPRVPGWVDGFFAAGIVALYAEGRDPFRVAATLAHELGHSLNRRAIGPALPPWLEEGLAEDLERLAAAVLLGRPPEPAAVPVDPATAGVGADPLALSDLRSLIALGDQEFHSAPARELHRRSSGRWVAYLLSDGETGSARRGFRAFLAAVARGEPLAPELLLGHLGGDWEELESGFRSWLAAQAPAAG